MSHTGSRTHRSFVRRPGHDYSAPGSYFVTICARDRRHVFGEVRGGRPVLSPIGELADECLRDLSDHYPHVSIEARVIMPDHVHAIVVMRPNRDPGGRATVGAAETGPGATCAGDAGVAPTMIDAGREARATHASLVPLPSPPGRGKACLARAPGPQSGTAIPHDAGKVITPGAASTEDDAGVAPTMGGPGLALRAMDASLAPSPSPPARGEARLAHAPGRPADAIAPDQQATVGITSVRGDATLAVTFREPKRVSLGTVVGAFKAAVSRRMNATQGTPAATPWQRGFHDHVIRNAAALERARRYIEENPARWEAHTSGPPN